MRLFSTAGIPFYIPPVMVGWSPFLLILCFSNFLFCLFCVRLDLIILILVNMMQHFIVVLVCIYLMIYI